MIIDRLRALGLWLETRRVRRIVFCLFLCIATLLSFFPFVRFLRSGNGTDYRVWFAAGQAIWQGAELYPRNATFPFMYPPACALLVAIPAALGKAGLILTLALANSVAWALCIFFSVKLATGRERQFAVLLAVLPSLLLGVYIWSTYHLGQPSLILLALMLGGFLCLQRNRQLAAGALIASAAAIKAFPVLALFYLLYRRYWVAAISLVLVLLALLLLLPLPFRGIGQTVQDFQSWRGGMLRYEEKGIAQRQARGYSWKNQSIFGLANRMLRRVSAEEAPPPYYANLAALDFRAVNIFIFAVAALAGISFLAVMPRHPTAHSDAFEFSALLILILLFTPLAFGYLFIWLLLPLAVLLQRVLTRGDRTACAGIAASLALLAITALAPRLAQIYGSVFFAALALYLTIAVELWRARSRPDQPPVRVE